MTAAAEVHSTQLPGYRLLELLSLSGWQVAVTAGFAGGILVIAHRHGHEIREQGDTVADVAHVVYTQAMRLQRPS